MYTCLCYVVTAIFKTKKMLYLTHELSYACNGVLRDNNWILLLMVFFVIIIWFLHFDPIIWLEYSIEHTFHPFWVNLNQNVQIISIDTWPETVISCTIFQVTFPRGVGELKAVKYFHKKVCLRCLIRFWTRLRQIFKVTKYNYKPWKRSIFIFAILN